MSSERIFNISGNYIESQTIYVQGNYIEGAATVAETTEAETTPNETPAAPAFEDSIPEHLRTGRLFAAWNQLRSAGILAEDYRLAAKTSKAAARYIVECFCQNKPHNEWAPFEKFWQIASLRWAKGDFSKEQEEKISKIFREL